MIGYQQLFLFQGDKDGSSAKITGIQSLYRFIPYFCNTN